MSKLSNAIVSVLFLAVLAVALIFSIRDYGARTTRDITANLTLRLQESTLYAAENFQRQFGERLRDLEDLARFLADEDFLVSPESARHFGHLLLEPGIAEMAAQNATPEDIERLRRLCDRVETKIHEGDRYIEDDIAFHTCIAESSKNLVVGQLIPIIDTAVMMFVNVTHKKLIDETIMTHRMIVEAIANHDPIGAKSAMVMHLNFNRTYIKKAYDGEDPDDGIVGMAQFVK